MQHQKKQDHSLIEEAQALLRASIERSSQLIRESEQMIQKCRVDADRPSEPQQAG